VAPGGRAQSVSGAASAPLDYLIAFPPASLLRCVGIVDGRLDAATLGRFEEEIFDPLRLRGQVDLVVVHHGPDDPELRTAGLRRGIRVKTWNEYNDLLEASAYRSWLRTELDAHPLYPQQLYQPQRFQEINRFGRTSGQPREDLLTEVHDALLGEDSQFLLILGDAGSGRRARRWICRGRWLGPRTEPAWPAPATMGCESPTRDISCGVRGSALRAESHPLGHACACRRAMCGRYRPRRTELPMQWASPTAP
jgi:hypothetical protein